VQARRRHGHHDIAGDHALGAQDRVAFHNSGRGAGEVVLIRAKQSWMLGGFTAQQRTAGLAARHGNPLDDRRNPFWIDPAAGNVVGHEERFGPTDNKVIDHHADQIEADGVVAVQCLSDGNLGAYSIGRGSQHRMPALDERAGIEESREAADTTDDFGTASLDDPLLHQLDCTITGVDIYPGRRVRRLVSGVRDG
jgi:hypothetical protein